MIVADPLTLNVLCNAILNNNREIKIHIFVSVYDFYTKYVVSNQFYP